MAMGKIIMTTEELILKYTLGTRERFSRIQKNFFINEMGNDFKNLGYSVKVITGNQKKRKGYNLVVGDLENASTIIHAYYDTPSHYFGNPAKYHPFNGPSTFASAFLPSITPLIICSVIAFYIFFTQVPNFDFTNRPLFSYFYSVLLFIMLIVPTYMMNGVANKVNSNRNTSGCVAALKTAEVLSEEQRKKVAFVLTDYGCSHHTGDYILRNAIPDSIDKKLVILLDCVGNGTKFAVGYKEGFKELATKLANCFENSAFKVNCPPENLRYTSFSFYPKSLLISKIVEHKNSLIVENTSTKNDIYCHEEDIDAVANALKDFIK